MRARTATYTAALDAATAIAWFGADALIEHILGSRHPVWITPFLLSQGVLLYALVKLRRLGRPLHQQGMGPMLLKVFVAVWALALPFMNATVMGDVAGVTGMPAPYEGAPWQFPVVISAFIMAFIYPLWLAWTITLPASGTGWDDEEQVSRAELWNAAGVNLYLILTMPWVSHTLGDENAWGQLIAASLILSVPRFIWLSYRFRPAALMSLVALLIWGLITQAFFS